jgi:hypothetical protein
VIWKLPPPIVTGEYVKSAVVAQALQADLTQTVHKLALKTADQTMSSSTTLIDDSDLFFAHDVNELWFINLTIKHQTTVGNQGLKVQFQAAADAQLYFQYWEYENSGTTQFNWNWSRLGNTTSFDDIFSGTNMRILQVRGMMYTLLAGTFRFRWAQNTAGNTTTVKAGSNIQGVRVGPNPGSPGLALA